MGKIIRDIKVVGPEDKLIIVIDAKHSEDMNRIQKIAEEFMNMKNRRVMCIIDTLRPYILKKGAKLSLAAIFEKMLEKGDKQ